MKRNLIAAAFTLTVLATAACGGGDAAVKPTATKSPTTSATSSPTSSPTPTIDPKAQPAVDAYLAYMTASNNALAEAAGAGAGLRPGCRLHEILVRPGTVGVQRLHPSVVVTGSEDGG